MRELLITAFQETIANIRTDLDVMPLSSWNESIFRFMYSRTVVRHKKEILQFFESNRIDLVLHNGNQCAFMEFKFYGHSRRYDPISGKKGGRKGFPSGKNRQEFEDSINKLRNQSAPAKSLKLVALFYSDPLDHKGQTYDSYYGDSSGVKSDLNINSLHIIPPFASNGSTCHASLYEVSFPSKDLPTAHHDRIR